MQEALTVLLRIAGYTDNLTGPWPLNYIAQGGKLDVTDDVTFAGSSACTRAAVAVMASNVLDVDVVYWDTDKAKHVEDTDSDNDTLTVLQDKFGAYTDEDVLFDSDSWGFDDFDDQELYLNYDGENNYGDELASTYWVSGGLNIGNLSNAIGNLILNDDKEIVYIDVTSTTAYSDDVTVTLTDDDSDEDNVETVVEALEISDKTVKLASSVGIINYEADDGDSSKEHDLSAVKIYYNDDGKVYLVQNVAKTGNAPAIFESYNSSKNRIDVYSDAGGSNISLKSLDIAILKEGKFIEADALSDGDILNKVGTADGSDGTYIVTSFKEGELTKASSSKLTIGGNSLVWVSQSSDDDGVTKDVSYYSDDAMDSFSAVTIEGLDGAYGTTVQYATKLSNPYDIDLVVFSGDAVSRLYGIITDINANINKQVSAITVLNADGEEVEYTLVKGDIGRPDYISYTEMADTDNDFDITFGSYIEAKVSDDGTIDTDDIIALVDPIYSQWALEDVDGVYDAASEGDEIVINSNRIKLNGVYYTLNDDTQVFQTTYDGDEFDEGEVVDVADLKAADEITSGYVLAFVDDGVCQQIYMLDTDINSTGSFGVLDDVEYRSGNWYASLLDGSEYKIANSNYADDADQIFFKYTVSDSKISITTPILVRADGDTVKYDDTALDTGYKMIVEDDPDLVDATSSRVKLGNQYYDIDDDTVFYVIEDGEISEGDIYDIETGSTAVIGITTDDYTDYIFSYVFIIKDAVNGSEGSVSLVDLND